MEQAGAEAQKIKAELGSLPRQDQRSEAQIQQALDFHRRPRAVELYLQGVGVRRRLREESHHVDTTLIPPECLVWLEHRQQGAAMILCGPAGSGKSTAAIWCLRRAYLESELIIKEGEREIGWACPSAQYIKVGDLYASIFDRNTQLIRRAETVDILVIDDWGQQYEHAWPLSRMDQLIDRRWDDILATIVTTNMQPEQDLKQTLPRAYDRLVGDPGPGVVVLDRPSLRRRAESHA